jgi:hypothetical protein
MRVIAASFPGPTRLEIDEGDIADCRFRLHVQTKQALQAHWGQVQIANPTASVLVSRHPSVHHQSGLHLRLDYPNDDVNERDIWISQSLFSSLIIQAHRNRTSARNSIRISLNLVPA